MNQLQRIVLASILLCRVAVSSAYGDTITDAKLRMKLQTKAQAIAAALKWPPVTRPWITESRIDKRLTNYMVSWKGGYVHFSPGFAPRFCHKSDSRKVIIGKTPPLPKLSQSDAKRAQVIARRTCEALGLGKIASFKEVVVKRTPVGMYFPIVSVECRLKVDSPIRVHELSVPIVSMELEPGSLAVNRLTADLPVVVEPLRVNEDKEKAKKVIAEYAKRRYGLNLNPERMKVDLWLIDWHEGYEGSPESQRLRSLRRWLIPTYEYDLPKIGQIWFNANTMKLLGVREIHPQYSIPRQRTQ